MDSIRAIITRIISKDEATGRVFALIRYETANGLVDSKMGGPGAEFSVGDFVIAEGAWRSSTFRGRSEETFTAKSIRPDLPATPEGAARWFASIFTSERHGVTVESAKALARELGAQAAFLCEQTPELILKASRDPVAFRAPILRDWGRRISGRRAVKLMQKSGVPPRAIDSILDAFRDAAFDTLQDNPYRAARVKNVGFGNANKIGASIGIGKDDPRRVQAAVVEVLEAFRSEGHSWADSAMVGARMEDQFDIPVATVTQHCLAMIGDGHAPVVIDCKHDQVILMLRDLFEGEGLIGKKVANMLANGRRNHPAAAKKVVDALFASDKYKRFDDVQRSAVLTSVIEPFSILTGGPGTGKSTVSEVVVHAAAELDSGEVFLCAPTGKAAKRLEETTGRQVSTIHHLLQANEDLRTGTTTFNRNRNNPLSSGCFVLVDEASMIDIGTMRALMDALPSDGRIVLVGDPGQLPSVDAGAVLHDLMEARDEQERRIVPCSSLVKVYRQTGDSRIAIGAADIRNGLVPALTNEFKEGLILYERNEDEVVDRVRWAVENVCKAMRLKPHQFVVLVPQAPGPVGTWKINSVLSRVLNPHGAKIPGVDAMPYDSPDQPLPRIGDRIMLTKNDTENDVMNGDVGTIVSAGPKVTPSGATRNMINIAFDCGKTVEYPAAQWRKLILAYAMTVHKSQGSQYRAVIMPVCMSHERMLDRRLFYTGWTRAKDALLLVGQREAIEMAIANVDSSKRNTRLIEFLTREANELGLHPLANANLTAPPFMGAAASITPPGASAGVRLDPPRASSTTSRNGRLPPPLKSPIIPVTPAPDQDITPASCLPPEDLRPAGGRLPPPLRSPLMVGSVSSLASDIPTGEVGRLNPPIANTGRLGPPPSTPSPVESPPDEYFPAPRA